MNEPEHPVALWWLAASPTLWSAHFLATYITVAIACAKLGNASGTPSAIRWAVAIYTLIALVLMCLIGRAGYRWYRAALEQGERTQDDSRWGRTGFLGFATLLLTGLSMIATIFVALPACFIGSCQ